MFKDKRWTTLLLFIVYTSRVGMGFYMSIWGPTLIYLALKVDTSVGAISSIFIGRSLGVMAGAFLASFAKTKLKNSGRKLGISIALTLGFVGITTSVIPLANSLLIVVLYILIGGFSFGYAETAMQSMLLRLWGEKDSRIHIQCFHFAFSIGAFMAPFVVKLFAFETVHSSPACSHLHTNVSNLQTNVFVSNTTKEYEKEEPIMGIRGAGWSFVCIGCYVTIIAIVFLLMSFFKLEGRASKELERKGRDSEARNEESTKSVLSILLSAFVYFFCAAAIECVYYSYIYTIAICSELSFTDSEAYLLTSLYWLGFGVGRLLAIPISARVAPSKIVSSSIISVVILTLLLSLWGEYHPWFMWINTTLLGAFSSILFPSGISWLSKIINVSGRFSCLFTLGAGFGALTMLPLGGAIYEVKPFSVIYLVFTLSLVTLTSFAVTSSISKKRNRKNNQEIAPDESEEKLPVT